MFLFSGTFFPLTVLPGLVQVLAVALLPLTQLVQVTRSLTLTTLSPLFFYSLAWVAVATVIFFLLSTWLMRRRLIV
jgi:lipooligosaccharide transport system permease protein